MGFFSDLKDDLSQAVNEMMPEDEPTIKEDEISVDDLPDVDLSSMLDKMESMDMVMEEAPEAPVEEAPISEPEAEEVAPEVAEVVPELIPEPETYKAPEPAPEAVAVPADNVPATEPVQMERKQILDETAVITLGMEVSGNITTQGSLDLVGKVIGNISALGKLSITGTIKGNSKAAEIYAEGAQVNGDIDSEGAIKIGQSTVVIGNITATSAVIAGAVKGDIDVRGPVILDGSAIVMGNIKSKYVQINNGAVVEGMCSQCYADVNPTSFFEELKKSL